jgi:ATP-binding cassette subfamily B protein
MYAIVGPSGSGKSTVVNLIPRLYDVNGGSVRIAGVDVRDFDLTYLREQIGVVTQESYLFNGTILENLRYAKNEASMEEIEEACKIANIHDFIISLPDGYDTFVCERGTRLSGGQKQRISIARVFLKNPPVLILDEATSALDNESERYIQKSLEQLSKGRTTLVIAHRLSTIRNADKIYVIEDGRIKEEGSHTQLLETNGLYAKYYNMQFED